MSRYYKKRWKKRGGGGRGRRGRGGGRDPWPPKPEPNILIRFLKWLFIPPKCKRCGRRKKKGFYVDDNGYCDNCRPIIIINRNK